MAISVSCACGKAFKVKDEAAGTMVTCQVCGRELLVQAPAVAAPETTVPQPLPAAAQIVEAQPASGPTIRCPYCAEDIPSGSVFCPLCGETLAAHRSKEEQQRLLAERLQDLERHAADLQAQLDDRKLKGAFLSPKTIFLALVSAIGILLIVAGCMKPEYSNARSADLTFGILIVVFMGIPAIVSLANDYRAYHIQDTKRPDVAFRRYYSALKSNRTAKAFASLVPSARTVGPVETVKFDNPKIPPSRGRYAISDLSSFKEYWKGIFSGPTLQTRGVQLRNLKVLQKRSDGTALVEVLLEFTNFNSLWALLLPLALLPAALLILVLQQHETRTFRKLLVNRAGRWYIAEGELEGVLDRLDI